MRDRLGSWIRRPDKPRRRRRRGRGRVSRCARSPHRSLGQPLDGGAPPDNRPARLLLVEVLIGRICSGLAIKSLRAIPALHDAPVLAAIGQRAIDQLDPTVGHADFLVWPCRPGRALCAHPSARMAGELVRQRRDHQARSARHRRRRARGLDRRGRAGAIDRAHLAGEFSLLVALVTRRGRVLYRGRRSSSRCGERLTTAVRRPSTCTCAGSARSSVKRCPCRPFVAPATSCAELTRVKAGENAAALWSAC